MFGYPKPVELVKTLITAQTFFDPNAIVLDFFAGSGTTAQAVMAANLRDEGQRSFILVQTPETLRGGRGGAGRGVGGLHGEFSTISELTAERIRRAADELAPGLTFTEVTVAEAAEAEAAVAEATKHTET